MAFDFSAVSAPFRMQPGLRRLNPGAPQLSPNRTDSPALHAKLQVLREAPQQALLCAPGFDAAPALQALVAQATTEQPQAFRAGVMNGAMNFEAPLIGASLRGDEPHGDGATPIIATLRRLPPPWRLPALLCLAFAEDLALIDGRDAHIPWLAVSLPSHWAPEDKVGHHFAEVHAPVADNRLLITAADHLAQLVTGATRWERFVWTITTHAGLDAHPRRIRRLPWPADADANADELAALAHFRTERQTFIPVPALRQAIFTIHVDSRPLAQAVTEASQARPLHGALASMSEPVLAYRGLTAARDRLLQWLAARAQAGPH